MEFKSRGVKETEDFAYSLAKKYKSPHIFCLCGDLGAGKTAFTRGLARGYGYTGNVTSPTFTLMNMYEGDCTICHFDLYRLKSEDEIYDAGLDAYIYDFISVIEWPDNFMDMFSGASIIEIKRGNDDNDRIISVREDTD